MIDLAFQPKSHNAYIKREKSDMDECNKYFYEDLNIKNNNL